MGLPLCEAKRHHKSTILNRNFVQEKNDRYSNRWFGSLGFCCNKIWTHKPQTDHKVQVKGIMVVCYFGMVFNRSSQLDHGLVVGLPLCEAKRHHKSTILNRNFIQEKNDRFSNCWFGSLGFCCNKIWTQKPQTDHKVQVKGIMVVCYFGMVFNRSSQLDHWSLCGSPPLWSQKASQINNFK